MPRSTAIVGRNVEPETISRRFLNARRGVGMGKRIGKSVGKLAEVTELLRLFSGFRGWTRGTLSLCSVFCVIVQFVAAFFEDS